MLRRGTEDIKTDPNRTTRDKNTMSAIKSTLDEINGRLNLQSKILINLKTQQLKPAKMKQRNMTEEISEQSISELWNNFKQVNLCVIEVLE